MKKLISILLPFLLLLPFAACQENPEGSIVVHKDMDNLISLAQKDSPERADILQIAGEVKKDFPTYSALLQEEDLRIEVSVNANVEVPDAEKLSVYRVKQKKFDQEFVDQVRKALMGDKAVYESDALYEETKSDVEGQLRTYRELLRQAEKELAGGEPTTYAGPPMSQEEWEEYCQAAIEGYQESINMLQERYETAPEEIDPARYPSEGKLLTKRERYALHPEFYFSAPEEDAETEVLDIIADPSDGSCQTLSVKNSAVESNTLFYYSCPGEYLSPGTFRFDPLDPDYYADNIAPGCSVPEDFLTSYSIQPETILNPLENDETTIPEGEAVRRAEDFLREIGLSDFTLTEGGLFNEIATSLHFSDPDFYYRHYYILRFRRELDGVALTQAGGDKKADVVEASPYREKQWPGEIVELRINDAGIAGFAYQAPIEVTETVVENASMKPFSAVKDTFEKMICIVNAPEDSNLTAMADIDKVRLSYSRISEKNDFDSGLIVPVWSFEGKIRYGFRGDYGIGHPGSHLTINAIDGSIIDKTLGY